MRGEICHSFLFPNLPLFVLGNHRMVWVGGGDLKCHLAVTSLLWVDQIAQSPIHLGFKRMQEPHTSFQVLWESVSFFLFLLDFIVLAVWIMLALSGVTMQLRRERSEVPFPPHPYLTWKRERERRSTNVLDPSHHIPPLRERIHSKLLQIKELFQKEQPAGERTPLLL